MSEHDVENRLRDLEVWVVRGLAFMVVFALSSVIFAALYAIHERQALDDRVNGVNQALSCYIDSQLDRATITLPTLKYYKDNPEELKQQIFEIRRQRAEAIDVLGVCLSDGNPTP